MGKIRDAVEGVPNSGGGQPHQLERLLNRISPEDAADIVRALKNPDTNISALKDAVETHLGFSAHRTTWWSWAVEARGLNGRFDRWAPSKTS